MKKINSSQADEKNEALSPEEIKESVFNSVENMGKESINRFVSHEFRVPEFERMAQDISGVSHISVELVKVNTEKALIQWEKNSKRDVLTLFIGHPEDRFAEISKMVDYLRSYLSPLANSEKILNKSMQIAIDSLERMYYLY